MCVHVHVCIVRSCVHVSVGGCVPVGGGHMLRLPRPGCLLHARPPRCTPVVGCQPLTRGASRAREEILGLQTRAQL